MIGIFKNVLKFLINIITLIVFLFLVLIIAAKVIMLFDGKEYFEMFGYSVFDVVTGSMEPAISQNDIIVVNKNKNYDIGDVITYKKDGEYITHRIESISTDYVVTKGDANNVSDSGVSKDNIVGTVVKVVKNGGVWKKIFTTPSIIISVFITLIAFDFAFSYKGNKNRALVKQIEGVDLEKVKDSSGVYDCDIEQLYKKIEMIKEKKNVDLDKKEKEFIDYTIRLDLKELKKGIDSKLNEENNESK